MLYTLLNKTLILLFFMSCLVVLRHSFYFIQALLLSTEENQVKYKLTSWSLFILCLSLANILLSITTGIKI